MGRREEVVRENKGRDLLTYVKKCGGIGREKWEWERRDRDRDKG